MSRVGMKMSPHNVKQKCFNKREYDRNPIPSFRNCHIKKKKVNVYDDVYKDILENDSDISDILISNGIFLSGKRIYIYFNL